LLKLETNTNQMLHGWWVKKRNKVCVTPTKTQRQILKNNLFLTTQFLHASIDCVFYSMQTIYGNYLIETIVASL